MQSSWFIHDSMAQQSRHSSLIGVSGRSPDGLFKGLCVRMGLHVGRPQTHRDPVSGRINYFAPWSTWRVYQRRDTVARSYSPQPLLRRLNRNQEATKRDLGMRSGAKGNVRLYESLPLALACGASPAQNGTRSDHELPKRLILFGRRQALEELIRHIGNGQRLISLVSPPGLGKTRLAQELVIFNSIFQAVFVCDSVSLHDQAVIDRWHRR